MRAVFAGGTPRAAGLRQPRFQLVPKNVEVDTMDCDPQLDDEALCQIVRAWEGNQIGRPGESVILPVNQVYQVRFRDGRMTEVLGNGATTMCVRLTNTVCVAE